MLEKRDAQRIEYVCSFLLGSCSSVDDIQEDRLRRKSRDSGLMVLGRQNTINSYQDGRNPGECLRFSLLVLRRSEE